MGASKSVLFNNTLNLINLGSWVFIISAGLFYVDTSTWTEHDGFLPFGWGGVLTGNKFLNIFHKHCKNILSIICSKISVDCLIGFI